MRANRETATRRSFLRLAGLGGLAGTAGCLSRLGFETRSARSPPLVEDRPDAVYVPSHVEGMGMVGTADAGPYRCALTFGFPHRFWLVTGRNRTRVDVEADDSVHLMVNRWDAETGIVPPAGSVTIEVERDDETVVEKPPWPMLSQKMGFHFGDNVALPGEGTYAVTVGIEPPVIRHTGAFEGRFGEPATAEFSFEFDRGRLEELAYRRLEDAAGRRGALDPMETESMRLARLPPADRLPGRPVGEVEIGDGRLAVTAMNRPPAGVDAAGYLAVSARTPYNRYPLALMGLSATLRRGGEAVFEGPLTPTLDPDLNFHYGAGVGDVRPGDALELDVGAPPQVARHEGYETAFLETGTVELTVP